MKFHLLNPILFTCSLMTGMFLMNSCEKNPHPDNEEELITTLRYELTPRGAGDKVVLSFSDPDGDGGAQPIITSSSNFKSGTVYDGTIILLNESVSPADNISSEVESESKDHQFFYQSITGTGGKLQIAYNDKDSDNLPLGLRTVVTAAAKGTGKLTVTLRHLPDKKAAGVSEGDIANAGGETDIQVTFDVTIE
jgi:hypothetical protein